MSFKSDAHRRWWFANNLGTRINTGAGSQAHIRNESDALHYVNQVAYQQRKDREFEALAALSVPSIPASGTGPMPSLTDDEKAAFKRYRGDFGS